MVLDKLKNCRISIHIFTCIKTNSFRMVVIVKTIVKKKFHIYKCIMFNFVLYYFFLTVMLYSIEKPFCRAFSSGNLRTPVSVNFSSGKVDNSL